MNNSLSRQIMLSVLGLAILIVAVVGVSYAIFVTTLTGTKENEITTGTISMSFVEKNDGISITNALPMSVAEGKKLSGANNVYDFVVSSAIAGVTTVNYEVVAEKIEFQDKEKLSDKSVKLYLQKKENNKFKDTVITSIPRSFTPDLEISELGSPAEGMILYKGEFVNDSTEKQSFNEYFRLRMWLADDAIIDEVSRTFKVRISVYGKVL